MHEAAAPLALVLLFAVLFLGLWLWALISCITNKRLSDSNRIIAIILIVLFPLIGMIVYLCMPREEAQRKYGRKLTGRTSNSRVAPGTRGIRRTSGSRSTSYRS